MDYQILDSNIKLNKGKNVGKVLYIVEGEKREINIIANIFLNVLCYEEVISINRNGKRKYRTFSKKANPNSQIVIINSETSNISSITNTEFINQQIELLKEYGLEYDFKNSAIYYLFDADRNEDKDVIKKLISNFTNSREPNGENKFDSIGGMLLLNYPAIEAFVISNFENEMYKFEERFNFETQGLKEYISNNGYENGKLSEDTLKNAFSEMVESLKRIDVDKVNLDNTAEFNEKIFDFEVNSQNRYMLSLLLVSFIDLGIIEIC